MNIYRHTFAVRCPADDDQIIYDLVIESQIMIMAEAIIEEVRRHECDYHEALADRLFVRFGGQQTITARHRVHIETRRGFE